MKRSLVAVALLVLMVAAACGDAGTATTSESPSAPDPGAAGAATSTAPPPPSTSLAPTTTAAPTTTTGRTATTAPATTAAPGDDPFGIGEVTGCAGLVDVAMVMLQAVFDELGEATIEDLNAAGGALPGLEMLEREGARIDERTDELGCDADELEAALIPRLDELEPRGELAQAMISGLDEELDDPEPPSPPEGVEVFEVVDASHTEEPVAYPQDPPAGGPHHPIWQNCGFYTDPVINEHGVHSLEHGVVWITYDASRVEDAELDVLRALATEPKVLVSPYEGLGDTPVVATAWGAQLRLGSAIDARLEQFVNALRDASAPEPGASCENGIGEPE